MMAEKLSYRETARRFEVSSDTRVREWERIYLTEGLCFAGKEFSKV